MRKVRQLNKYDCLRANKSTMAWSVEARTPFLDRRFLEKAFSFDPKYKMCRDEDTNQPRMEKYLLRKAFDDAENPYLPKWVTKPRQNFKTDDDNAKLSLTKVFAQQMQCEQTYQDESNDSPQVWYLNRLPISTLWYLKRDKGLWFGT